MNQFIFEYLIKYLSILFESFLEIITFIQGNYKQGKTNLGIHAKNIKSYFKSIFFIMKDNIAIWNSLEIAKFIVSVATPLIVLLLGIRVNKRLKILEQLQWANQKLIEKRLQIYDQLIPLLNDILCYFTFIGCWKELKPDDVIKLKRTVDKIVYVNAPLFTEEFQTRYNSFIELCYSTYSGWGNDAKLRTAFKRRKEANPDWEKDWEDLFAEESEVSEPKQIRKYYQEFVKYFAEKIDIGLYKESVKSGRIPYNIK